MTTILLLIVILLINSDEPEQRTERATIDGYLLDSETGIGLINEFCVSLEQTSDGGMETRMFWPNDTSNRGYFRFDDVPSGEYRISLARSWSKVTLNDPDDKYLEGGWTPPEPVEFEVSGKRGVHINLSLDFHAHQTWTGELSGISLTGSHRSIFGYGDDNFLGDNTNLVGKTMSISVYWNNTNLAHADFTINIMDLYDSTEERYETGPQVETLTIVIDEDFLEYEDQYELADWTVDARVLPSMDPDNIAYLISWTID